MLYQHARKMVIKNGPSKMDLFAALAYAYGKQRLSVDFELDDGKVYRVIITEIAHEDGSGESFNLAGYINWHSRCLNGCSDKFRSEEHTSELQSPR